MDTLYLVEYYALNPDGGNYLIKTERIFAREGEINSKAKRRRTRTTKAIGIYRLESQFSTEGLKIPSRLYL